MDAPHWPLGLACRMDGHALIQLAFNWFATAGPRPLQSVPVSAADRNKAGVASKDCNYLNSNRNLSDKKIGILAENQLDTSR
jgi:hypothetical protein